MRYQKKYTELHGDSKDNAVHWLVSNGCRYGAIQDVINDLKIDINAKNSEGFSALDLASASDNLLGLLNTPGVNIEITKQYSYGRTLLHKAAMTDSPELIKLLLEKDGVDVNQKDNQGRTPLHTAFYGQEVNEFNFGVDNIGVIGALLRAPGVKLNETDNDGNSILHAAVNGGKYTAAVLEKALTIDNLDINVKNNLGETALHSLFSGITTPNVVQELDMLLAAGINRNAKDKAGNGILHSAAKCTYKEDAILADKLFSLGLDINAQNNEGKTPLEVTIKAEDEKFNKYDFAKTLINHGATVSPKILTILIKEKEVPDHEMITLCASKMDPSAPGGSAALLSVFKNGLELEALREVFAGAGAVNKRYDTGLTPLHIACDKEVDSNPFSNILSDLLAVPGININAKDKDGNTALEYIIKNDPEALTKITTLIDASTEITSEVKQFCLAQPALNQALKRFDERIQKAQQEEVKTKAQNIVHDIVDKVVYDHHQLDSGQEETPHAEAVSKFIR